LVIEKEIFTPVDSSLSSGVFIFGEVAKKGRKEEVE
jgi:hypothetical protein